MPHLTVEYSSNLEPELDVLHLLHALHRAVLATGVFELGALRTRAERREHYLVADGDPDNAFVHATLRVGSGRDPEALRRCGEQVFAALTEALEPVQERRGLGLSLELQEIHPALSFKQNTLHERMRAKGLTGVGS